MIETLFIVNAPNPKPKEATPRSVLPSPNVENRVLDPKKSQNIAILLRALNVTIEEVCEALFEGICLLYGYKLDYAFILKRYLRQFSILLVSFPYLYMYF